MEQTKGNNWQPLRELALNTPYTMEYLSLMARRRQLKVKKVGRLWYSTLSNIKEFEEEMKKRKEQRKEKMRNSYFKKPEPIRYDAGEVKKHDIKVKVSQGSIYDQIENELEEVLEEIRAKERMLREQYRSVTSESKIPISLHGPLVSSKPTAKHHPRIGMDLLAPDKIREEAEIHSMERSEYLQKEKQETEELSEKLIMDLGRLLNTANQIKDDAEIERSDNRPKKMPKRQEQTRDEYTIPVRSQLNGIASHEEKTERVSREEHHQRSERPSENHAPFLSLNYPYHRREEKEASYEYYNQEHDRYDFPEIQRGEGKWFKIFISILIGLLVFMALVLILFLIREL